MPDLCTEQTVVENDRWSRLAAVSREVGEAEWLAPAAAMRHAVQNTVAVLPKPATHTFRPAMDQLSKGKTSAHWVFAANADSFRPRPRPVGLEVPPVGRAEHPKPRPAHADQRAVGADDCMRYLSEKGKLSNRGRNHYGFVPHAQFVSPEVGAGTSCGVDHGPSVELDQRMKVLIGERGLA